MWFGSKHKWSSGSFFKVSRVRIFLGGHKKDNFYSFHGKYDYEKKKDQILWIKSFLIKGFIITST